MELTRYEKQEKCLNLVRTYLQQNHIKYDEKKSSTGTSYFYIEFGSNFSRIKLRVADHDSRHDVFGWDVRGFTYEIRSDDPRFPFGNNPMKYVERKIDYARKKSAHYGMKNAWQTVKTANI